MKTKNLRLKQAHAYIRRMKRQGHTWDSAYLWSPAACARIVGHRHPFHKRY